MEKTNISEKYKNFLENFTEFIFVENVLKKADVIFVPGNGYPQMAERAAQLWRSGYAPWVLPSGRYSVVLGKFVGVQAHEDRYTGSYETECDFLTDVLLQNGVDSQSLLREDQATYTYQNAVFSRNLLDERKITVSTAIVCCKAQHARRCKLYYELLFPETEILICPVDVGVNRENWYLSEEGREEVLGEVERCGGQFHKILRELAEV